MTSSDPSDASLLADHVAGDPAAFGMLFARHRDRLWAVALRTTGNPEDAADALQEAMISAFRRAETFRGQSSVTTWLHRIVVNACLDRLRHQKSRRAEPLPEDLDRFVPADSSREALVRSADPLDEVVRGDRRAAVLAALATLPPDHRAALVLVDMEGYPIAEVAEMLGCAPGTVKSRCSRGRARLRELLGDVARDTVGNLPGAAPVPSTEGTARDRPSGDQSETDETRNGGVQ